MSPQHLHHKPQPKAQLKAQPSSPVPKQRWLGIWSMAAVARLLSGYGWVLGSSCAVRVLGDDPRAKLRQNGQSYTLALLHAHQIAAIVGSDEPRLCTVVSRSKDGGLLLPLLKRYGIDCIRGSSERAGAQAKGGLAALRHLIRRQRSGDTTLFAIDGPTGPRGYVQPGIVALAQSTQAAIVPMVAVCSQKWILQRTWDRMQIPKPTAQISLVFGEPITPHPSQASTTATQIAQALAKLEAKWEPSV